MIEKEFGRVLRFNPTTGWGFIERLPDGVQVFIHQQQIRMNGFREVRPGDYVMFDLEKSEKGLSARAAYVMFPDDAVQVLMRISLD